MPSHLPLRKSQNFIRNIHTSQAGFDPMAQSPASYEASALPPSHHGWITKFFGTQISASFWQ